MKRPVLLTLHFLLFSYLIVSAQDIPLFTQKLTNSFLYNPSVAGKTLGSLTLSHRQYWSGLQGSPSTNFVSFHTPFANHRFGVGANLYQDNIGVSQTMHASAAFAYHIRFRNDNSFSMGVSGEYNNFKISQSKVDVIDSDDALLQKSSSYGSPDFSFGMSYQAKYYRLGASANRISTLLGIQNKENQFPAYYSGFVNFMIPLAGERDLLEPIVTYRTLSPGSGSHQIDLGLYYTYNSMFTLGAGYRSGSIVNATASVKIKNSISLGYSRDIYTGTYGKNIGSSNEVTLRFDFLDQSFFSKAKNSRKINTTSLAVRRKTLSTYNRGGTSSQKSKRYKRSIKKHYMNSPNYRITSSNKLNTMRMKKSPYKKRKR